MKIRDDKGQKPLSNVESAYKTDLKGEQQGLMLGELRIIRILDGDFCKSQKGI